MKHMRWICALALIAALLLALPALAEGTTWLPTNPEDETSQAYCGASATGEHQVADDAWTVVVEPSCMQGYRVGYCTACGLFYNQVLPATGEHLWDDGTVTTKPTCETAGVKTYNCIMCNDATKTEPIAAAGHTWDAGVVTTAPTCTTAGVKTFTCTVCDATTTETIPALDHDFSVEVTPEVPATCGEDGTTAVMQCSRCTEQQGGDPIPATGEHTWDAGVETTAPTCTTAGVKTFTCTVCGETKTEEIPALDHDFSVEVTPEAPATCTTEGTTAVMKCSRCEATEGGETIPALDHDFSVEVTAEVPATCTTDGTTAVMKCSRCTETEGGDPIPAPGHTVTTWELVEKATCSTEGKETGVCDVCGETVEQAIPIDPVAHAFDNGVETPATCTVDGKVVYTCKLCNATQEVAIPATGHTWDAGVETTAPGCETEGVKTYTCTVCDATKTEPIPATGHKPDAGRVTKEPTCTENGVKTYTCTVCGKHLDEAIPAEGHDWGEWVTLRQATEEQNGEQERTCQVCGATQTREVQYKGDMPKTGVFTVPTAWLVAVLALSLTGYAVLKRKSVRG